MSTTYRAESSADAAKVEAQAEVIAEVLSRIFPLGVKSIPADGFCLAGVLDALFVLTTGRSHSLEDIKAIMIPALHAGGVKGANMLFLDGTQYKEGEGAEAYDVALEVASALVGIPIVVVILSPFADVVVHLVNPRGLSDTCLPTDGRVFVAVQSTDGTKAGEGANHWTAAGEVDVPLGVTPVVHVQTLCGLPVGAAKIHTNKHTPTHTPTHPPSTPPPPPPPPPHTHIHTHNQSTTDSPALFLSRPAPPSPARRAPFCWAPPPPPSAGVP